MERLKQRYWAIAEVREVIGHAPSAGKSAQPISVRGHHHQSISQVGVQWQLARSADKQLGHIVEVLARVPSDQLRPQLDSSDRGCAPALAGVCDREQVLERRPWPRLFGPSSDHWSKVKEHLTDDLRRELVDGG